MITIGASGPPARSMKRLTMAGSCILPPTMTSVPLSGPCSYATRELTERTSASARVTALHMYFSRQGSLPDPPRRYALRRGRLVTSRQGSLPAKHHLNYVCFSNGLLRKTIQLERRQVKLRIASGDHVGEDAAGSRRVLEAVAAEPGDRVEALDVARRANDRVVIRRHLVEARPCVRHRGIGECGQALHGHFDHLRQEIPPHGNVESRRLVRIAHPKEQAAALAVVIERG